MRALIALVLQDLGLDATCLLPPLARMMQASERALVNEGLEEGLGVCGLFRRLWPLVLVPRDGERRKGAVWGRAMLDALGAALLDIRDGGRGHAELRRGA